MFCAYQIYKNTWDEIWYPFCFSNWFGERQNSQNLPKSIEILRVKCWISVDRNQLKQKLSKIILNERTWNLSVNFYHTKHQFWFEQGKMANFITHRLFNIPYYILENKIDWCLYLFYYLCSFYRFSLLPTKI